MHTLYELIYRTLIEDQMDFALELDKIKGNERCVKLGVGDVYDQIFWVKDPFG